MKSEGAVDSRSMMFFVLYPHTTTTTTGMLDLEKKKKVGKREYFTKYLPL